MVALGATLASLTSAMAAALRPQTQPEILSRAYLPLGQQHRHRAHKADGRPAAGSQGRCRISSAFVSNGHCSPL